MVYFRLDSGGRLLEGSAFFRYEQEFTSAEKIDQSGESKVRGGKHMVRDEAREVGKPKSTQ